MRSLHYYPRHHDTKRIIQLLAECPSTHDALGPWTSYLETEKNRIPNRSLLEVVRTPFLTDKIKVQQQLELISHVRIATTMHLAQSIRQCIVAKLKLLSYYPSIL